jgi:hypothetical protein
LGHGICRPPSPPEWARAISTSDATDGYILGAVDPDTGTHRRRQLANRLYLDTDRQANPVRQQVVTCPGYLLSAIDGSRDHHSHDGLTSLLTASTLPTRGGSLGRATRILYGEQRCAVDIRSHAG